MNPQSYDEDIQNNEYFKALKDQASELYKAAIDSKWLICVPRTGSFERDKFNDEDFLRHVIVQHSSNPKKIKCKNLTNQNISISDGLLTINSGSEDERVVKILFDEKFYTEENDSFVVYCLDEPLNNTEKSLPKNIISSVLLDSVEDSKCLLFRNKKNVSLQRKVDNYLCHFVEHQLPKLAGTSGIVEITDAIRNLIGTVFSEVITDSFLKKALATKVFTEDLIKSAIELYLLNELYPSVFRCLTDICAVDDARVNKATRNWHCARPETLGVRSTLSDSIPIARREFDRIQRCTTPCGKTECLRRVSHVLTTNVDKDVTDPVTGEDMLAVYILLVVKSNIPNWYAHLTFAREFRFTQKPNDEEERFYLTTLEASLLHVNSMADKSAPQDDVILPDHLAPIKKSTQLIDFFKMIQSGEVSAVRQIVQSSRREVGSPRGWRTNTHPSLTTVCHPLCQCLQCRPVAGGNALPVAMTTQSAERRPTWHSGARREGPVQTRKGLLEDAITVHSQDDRGWTGLHVASASGQANLVASFLDNGADPELGDVGQGRTPLHLACSEGHQEAILVLLGAGVNINRADIEGYRPLHLAAERAHEKCVKTLLYFGAANSVLDVDAADSRGNTALHLAAQWGYEDVVELLLEAGANPTARNNLHQAPACLASTGKLTDRLATAVRTFSVSRSTSLSSGFHEPIPGATLRRHPQMVHSAPTYPSSPGHSSTLRRGQRRQSGSPEVQLFIKRTSMTGHPQESSHVEQMLKAAADGDLTQLKSLLGLDKATDDDDNTVDFSRELCHPLCQCSRCLPRQQLSMATHTGQLHVNCTNDDGFTALHVTAIHGHVTLTRFLLECGADPCRQTRNLATSPLHLAALYNNLEVLVLLVQLEAPGRASNLNVVDCQDAQGGTPLHYACLKGHYSCAKFLVQSGADVSLKNNKGNTALHECSRRGHAQLVRCILGAGASPTVRNTAGATPADVAVFKEISRMLNRASHCSETNSLEDTFHSTGGQTDSNKLPVAICTTSIGDITESGVYSHLSYSSTYTDHLEDGVVPSWRTVADEEDQEDEDDAALLAVIARFQRCSQTSPPRDNPSLSKSTQSTSSSEPGSPYASRVGRMVSPQDAYRLVFPGDELDSLTDTGGRDMGSPASQRRFPLTSGLS